MNAVFVTSCNISKWNPLQLCHLTWPFLTTCRYRNLQWDIRLRQWPKKHDHFFASWESRTCSMTQSLGSIWHNCSGDWVSILPHKPNHHSDCDNIYPQITWVVRSLFLWKDCKSQQTLGQYHCTHPLSEPLKYKKIRNQCLKQEKYNRQSAADAGTLVIFLVWPA